MALFRTSSLLSGPLEPADPEEAKKTPITREEIALVHAPRGPIAEQFRSLRNSVQALNPDGAPRTLVLTSAVAGEGKSVAAINLALALTEVPGTRVLLVDADLHRPSLEGYLGLPRRQGLTELVRGACPIDRAIRQTSANNVWLLGAGELPQNPSELLGSERMRTIIAQFKQRYTYILIDTPEALTISDASLLGAQADGVLLVVRLNATPRHLVEQTYNLLEGLGANVLGTCLTGAGIASDGERYAKR
ncbi:MAG: CpsD/CapB family tyrosine-protein kinase [Planctomycetes bacterium]|nr:CpsD/CapB family tyrosine-protein kinase [Planctomycetota bacterium]